jgi:UDP-N-acetylmuramate dehydrogenase
MRPAVDLAKQTSLRVGGWAREFHVPGSLEELQALLGRLDASPFILGGGNNVLFPDGEFSRPVISTSRLNRLRLRGTELHAECGVRLGQLLQSSLRAGLSGLEGLAGIPGTAGGAVVMNAGGGGWSFGQHVSEIGILPLDGGDPIRLGGREVAWGYRSSDLPLGVVGWVTLRLARGDSHEIRERVRSRARWKSRRQPMGQRSAGCVFKNPPGVSAGKLIDDLGLKGLSCGGARVSDRHANFIVNSSGKARAEDVRSLLEDVRSRVAGSHGVRLETEIILAGESRVSAT